jgi:hypothetical protein
MSVPSFVEPLRAELESSDLPFRPIDPDIRSGVTELLLGGFRMFSFDEAFQAEGEARITRSIPLFAGPIRQPRLTSDDRAMILLADPEHDGALFAALGPNLPPQLWPHAEPTAPGIARDLGAYFTRPFVSAHRLARSLRIFRGNLEELGLESIDKLAQVIGHGEQWMDGAATWRSDCLDDPWPDDPSRESMLTLRVIANKAQEENPARRSSISMRTLWSRSVLTIELSQWGYVVFELRWDPAPKPRTHGVGEGLLPDDLPADLRASLLRGGSALPSAVAEMRKEEMTPWAALMTCVLEPTERTTYDMLRRMLHGKDPELQGAAIQLACDAGAMSLLYELGCETDDAAVRDRILQLTELGPPAEQADRDDDDDESEDESESEDDDERDDEYEDEDGAMDEEDDEDAEEDEEDEE